MRIKWRGFELPVRVVSEEDTKTDSYAKFIADDLHRLFGIAILQHRRSRDDFQTRDLRQLSQQIVMHAVHEELVVLIRATVGKG